MNRCMVNDPTHESSYILVRRVDLTLPHSIPEQPVYGPHLLGHAEEPPHRYQPGDAPEWPVQIRIAASEGPRLAACHIGEAIVRLDAADA